MVFRCGIVGLPNVGKSTLFNALTKLNREAKNFPFCTIKPNNGVVPVPDSRINQIANIIKPQRIIPTKIEFVDIAGLVKGASKGEGLGNCFLTHIRETEAIGHVVRCFESDHVIHVTGEVNPEKDIDIVNTELTLSDLEVCERAIHRLRKCAKIKDKNTQLMLLVLEKCFYHLNNIGFLRKLHLSNNEKKIIRCFNFLTLKPVMYIANVNENGFDNNPYLNKVRAIASTEGSIVVAISAAIEAEIAKFEEKEQNKLISELGVNQLNLNNVIRATYELLNLQTYFTAGKKEVHAWTIPVGSTVSQAAKKIHTDFQKGFICSHIISFSDFIAYKGYQRAKEAGKIRSEGKNYLVKDGDVINFLFNI